MILEAVKYTADPVSIQSMSIIHCNYQVMSKLAAVISILQHNIVFIRINTRINVNESEIGQSDTNQGPSLRCYVKSITGDMLCCDTNQGPSLQCYVKSITGGMWCFMLHFRDLQGNNLTVIKRSDFAGLKHLRIL